MKNHKWIDGRKKIDYPASLSVIKLSDNSLTETIELMNHSGTHSIMWPNHIYHHQSDGNHLLAVGISGMDLSGGHTGGCRAMVENLRY